MNKILCRRDLYDDTGRNSFDFYKRFKEGELYNYEHKTDKYLIFDKKGNSDVFYIIHNVDLFNLYFYTPEETFVILRKNKIDKIINE